MSWQELNEIAAKLPPRTPRRREGEEVLELIPSSEDSPDARVRRQEKNAGRARALVALQKALKTLTAEDRLILRMRQWNHFSVKEIAKVLKLERVPLYKRIEKTKEHLRKEMERQGIRKEDIQELFDE